MIQTRRYSFPFSRAPEQPELRRERTELENVVKFLQTELDVLKDEINGLQESSSTGSASALANLTLRVIAIENELAALDLSNMPTSSEKAALVGTDGSPSASNPYVTDSDPRLSSDPTEALMFGFALMGG